MDIQDLGKGLIGPHPNDTDPKANFLHGIYEVAGGNTNIFDTSLGLKVPPDENQGSSSSCTWQAFSYYFWQWTGIQLSRQDGYSRTHLAGGGGYLIDPFRTMMDSLKGSGGVEGSGAYDRDQHQDPFPQTENVMIVKVNLPGQVRKTFKIRYWNIPYNDITAMALAAKQYKGIVIGLWGDNADWSNLEHPNPPKPGSSGVWGHALYAMDIGYDRSQPCLICKSSWCRAGHNKHFIINDYVTSGNVYSPLVMEVKEVSDMDKVLFIVSNGKYGFISINDGRILGGALAANPDELKTLAKVFEYGKEVIRPDGSFLPVDANLDFIN